MKEFINKLKELREEKRLQQKELAELLNVSKSTISGWEVGRNEPKQEMLIKIATIFEVTTDYLLGREDDFGSIKTSSENVSGNHNAVVNANAHISESDAELLRKYHNTSVEMRKAIDKLLS